MKILWILSILFSITFYVIFSESVPLNSIIEHEDDSNGIELDEDNDNDNTESISKELNIASIKSRAIAMDREICSVLSRYHPHYPRCQDYCKKLNHWMGMCRRHSCHCYS
ncbi:uncharacterized protein LOC119673167 [Teleopsis dalmanni]|uniref:uncharacterized protein LOC119665827 n=1 Tax=Teleopsis dalmanni TaxID=139649 RepID=UPI0018CD26FB|nr:uncharacterized protein LOC119665827 [Teleopsis dalmanni]XP_037940333.1 uncharacterized protein LOC119673167 [Teleopsis dalmanni]